MEQNNTNPVLYEIERIINRRETEKGTEYLIKWKDFPLDGSTWESLVNLLEDKAHEAIAFYESQTNDTPPKDVILFLMEYNQMIPNSIDNKIDNYDYNDDDEKIDSEDDINKMEEDWMINYGSLPRDSIKRIIKLERNQSDNVLYALVEWNMRVLSCFKPPDSLIKTSKLKKYCLKLYIDFLEGIMYTDKLPKKYSK